MIDLAALLPIALKAGLTILALGLGLVTTIITKRKMPDNPIEQFAEQVIKDQTGVDLDFSSSPDEENK